MIDCTHSMFAFFPRPVIVISAGVNLFFLCRCRVLTVFMAAIVAIDAVDDVLVVVVDDVVVGACTYCCSCCSCGGSGGGDDGDTKSKI